MENRFLKIAANICFCIENQKEKEECTIRLLSKGTNNNLLSIKQLVVINTILRMLIGQYLAVQNVILQSAFSSILNTNNIFFHSIDLKALRSLLFYRFVHIFLEKTHFSFMQISILMPVFNAENYLTECLDSILAQSINNWELIAVNDFSTDQSGVILQAFAKKDNRIKVIHNQEKGIIPALRLAFAKSTGQLITRMDADDKMHPQKLQLLQQKLLEHGPGHLATAYVTYFSAKSLGGGYQRYEQWLNALTEGATNYADIYRECVIPSPCWMCYREDLEQCGAFEPDVYPEDYDLCFRFYKENLKVLGVKQQLHYWRDYPERTSRNDEHYADALYLHLKLHWFLQLDYHQDQPLFVWGAGKKGKAIAKHLSKEEVPFHWICNQPSKWGHNIYGTVLQPISALAEISNVQIIIAVANPDDQKEIKQYLKADPFEDTKHWFFC
jgi:glycosyltransferase involved in cell wall biosynthesis